MSDLGERLQASLSSSYTIERELGGGGMSRVYLARDTALGRNIVVKVLAPELAAGVSAERFQREIRLAAALQHPNIVPVHASGAADELPYYTMPFVDGSTLRNRLSRTPPLTAPEVVSILKDVTRALAYAHEHGVVHRDIKPENILLSGDAAVVTDFGIAKAVQASRTSTADAPGATLTQVGTSLGTPAYMAPEQAAGDPATDHRADIYALGCVAYEMLTGSAPFAGKLQHQLFLAHATETPEPVDIKRPDCAPALAELVMRCLAKDPALRPQTARDIQQALDGDRTSSRHHAAWISRRAVALGVAIAVVTAAAFIALVALPTRSGETALERSVAVLPFDMIGGDTADAYFAEGIADELIIALSKVSGVRVAGRASSFRFRDKSADMRNVGRALNVATLLDGRVRRQGQRMRVSAQLTNVDNDSVLWSESYEREIQDAFAVQDEITRAITGALRLRFGGLRDTMVAVAVARPTDPDAYDAYLRGLALARRRGRFLEPAISYFEQAIAKDSGFARAWALLAQSLAALPIFHNENVQDRAARAFVAARRAIALDASSAEAHSALASAYMFVAANPVRAIPEFELALTLEPGYTQGLEHMAVALAATGEYDRAVASARRSIAIDPVSPRAGNILARVSLYARQYNAAVSAARSAIQLDSLQPAAPSQMAAAYYFLGRRDSARAVALRLQDAPVAGVHRAFVLAATGDRRSNEQLLRVLETRRSTANSGETVLASAYLGLGDTASALDALERATQRREQMFAVEFGHPMFDAIRASARFTSLLRAYGVDPVKVNSVMARKPQ